jgi:hypothetical protein
MADVAPTFYALLVSLGVAAFLGLAWLREHDKNEQLRRHGRQLPTLGTTPLPRAIATPAKTRKENRK